MLKLEWSCCNCHSNGNVENPSIIAGQCPVCGYHHGEVEYVCCMTKEEFETELTSMTEEEQAANKYAIEICKEDLGIE